MYKEQLAAVNECKNVGDNCELAIRRRFGCKPSGHDGRNYMIASDCECGNMRMSIKSSKFTLMSGSYCKDCRDFNDIWNKYEKATHSNVFVYVTLDFVAYFMNINEFRELTYTFGHVERESKKNGGTPKVRFATESKKVINWLEERVNVA
jgi:hypothetical protein